MPRHTPTPLRPRILALKPAEEASSSRSKSAAVAPDVNAPSRTVRPPFRLFDPFSAGLDQFQPTAFMAPVRTSVATEFNSGEQPYSTIKPRPPSIRNSVSSYQNHLNCRASSTQRSRSRVTFVILPATPRPVPSKKRDSSRKNRRFLSPPIQMPSMSQNSAGLTIKSACG